MRKEHYLAPKPSSQNDSEEINEIPCGAQSIRKYKGLKYNFPSKIKPLFTGLLLLLITRK